MSRTFHSQEGMAAAAEEEPVEEETKLKTIPNVPIVSTGTYHLGANAYGETETTFTKEDLADAIGAVASDGSIKSPRLKLGHTSDWGDAEPTFGIVDNMRLGDNGQTIYADFVGVPGWLAEVMPAIYPNRSVEAFFGVTTAQGNKWKMVITAVALLGVKLPGVASLDDLAGLYTDTVPDGTEIVEGTEVEAQIGGPMSVKVKASTNIDDVRRSFYESVAIGDQMWWWIREVYLEPNEIIVDDDDGHLYRMSFDVDGEEVEFGEASEVKIEYVTASEGGPPKLVLPEFVATAAASAYASRDESRPDATHPPKEGEMDRIRERLGLPADATEDDVLKALDEQRDSQGDPEQDEQSGDDASDDSDGNGDDEESSDDAEEGGEENAEENAEASLPDGMIAVPQDQWKRVQEGAAAGASLAASSEREKRDRTIEAAVKAGKIPPSERQSMENLHASNRDGFYRLLTAAVTEGGLAKGIVPVGPEIGAGAGDEGAVEGRGYDPSWLTEAERANAGGGASNRPGQIHQEAV